MKSSAFVTTLNLSNQSVKAATVTTAICKSPLSRDEKRASLTVTNASPVRKPKSMSCTYSMPYSNLRWSHFQCADSTLEEAWNQL